MNKFLLSAICLLGSFTSAIASNSSANNTNTSSNRLIIPNNGSNSSIKKFKMGFEFGIRGREDHYCMISTKKGFYAKIRNIVSNGNYVSLSQDELTACTRSVVTEIPTIVNTIRNLNNNDLRIFNRELETLTKVSLEKGTELTATDVKSSIDNICAILNITQIGQTNTWNILHDPKYLDTIVVFMCTPSLIRNNVTVAEVNQAMRFYVSALTDPVLLPAITGDIDLNTDFDMSDYINFDLFANCFINYNLPNNTYLIAGIGGSFDLDRKGHSFYGRRSKKDSSEKSEISADLDSLVLYRTKYAITPYLGFGLQFSKRFALEITNYDQITKIEYDCSAIYKTNFGKIALRSLPGITKLFPNRKQSNWVNRVGLELALKCKITKNTFAKLGMFYTFPCNIFKNIQPLDVKMDSGGASLSIGFTF